VDPVIVGALSVVLVIVLVVVGLPIAVALALVSLAGLWVIIGDPTAPLGMLASAAFHGVFDYTFSVVPMFVLMGFLANLSGAAEEAYDFAGTLLKGRRGGLAMATVAANALFAAVTGISIASAAMFSRVSLPSMLRHGYNRSFSLGTIAGSSILGMLIPPSVLLILYGIVARESIGTLFTAGVGPGILLAVVYSAGIWLMVRLRPSLVQAPPDDEQDQDGESSVRAGSLTPGQCLKMLPMGGLVVLVLGGIYAGVFTPTEAGAMGAFGALLLALVKRKLNLKNLRETMIATGYVTVAILFILVAANMYSRMITLSNLPTAMCDWLAALPLPPIMIMVLFMLILIVLGAILDSASIILITLPIMLPVVKTMGYNPIWFGIVSILAIETGLITPPFGLVVYTMKATIGPEVSVEEIFRGSIPFFLMMLLVLALVLVFPALSLWLPGVGR
jgi:tripartite ATP-independent transporter DctM subunit